MTMANEAILGITVRVQDEASRELQRIARETAQFNRGLRTAGLQIGRFGQAMTNMLVLANLLPNSMGKAINQTLLMATTTINAVYALSQLVTLYQTLAKAQTLFIALERGRAIATAIANAIATSGLSLALIPVALAGGVAVGAGINRLVEQGTKANVPAAMPGSSVVANVPAATSGGGPPSVTVINNGVMMGNDADARRLARQLQGFVMEDERWRGK